MENQVGSTRELVENDGDVAQRIAFASFGKVERVTDGAGATLSLSALATDILFTGYRRDSETGLDYAHARYYDAGIGRFGAEDPVRFAAGDEKNLYRYVTNNPQELVDPFGLESIEAVPTVVTGRSKIAIVLGSDNNTFSPRTGQDVSHPWKFPKQWVESLKRGAEQGKYDLYGDVDWKELNGIAGKYEKVVYYGHGILGRGQMGKQIPLTLLRGQKGRSVDLSALPNFNKTKWEFYQCFNTLWLSNAKFPKDSVPYPFYGTGNSPRQGYAYEAIPDIIKRYSPEGQ